ncbi:B9 domain-containing protein 1-like [Ischnura elegans]|uniref:B9 domain-containing protein 1-like n=1 Tax=Ischnura elegans TaxID=197161 RepID=UPI001ED8BCDE|nr:B9 domain-containing protein 1-like [Ischnura elegans]
MDESFVVSVTGQIESGEFPRFNELYCKYCFMFGNDWVVASGLEEGISQVSRKTLDGRGLVVWNLPLDISLKSTNPYGWPRLVVCVYGLDAFGNDVVRGYGMCHIPLRLGSHHRRLPMFVPVSASQLQKFTAWITGRRPEYVDPRVLGQGEGREATRVSSEGYTNVTFNVMKRNMSHMGYQSCPSSDVSAPVERITSMGVLTSDMANMSFQ